MNQYRNSNPTHRTAHFRWLPLLLALLFLSHGLAISSPALQGDDYETDQVVVKLDPAAGTTIDAINTTYGTTTLETLLGSAGIYLLQLPPGTDAADVANQMQGDPRLLYAEPNFIGQAPEADPSRTYAWGGQSRPPYATQYATSFLGLAWAQDITRGKGVIIAVLDTGVQLTHAELAPSLTTTRYDFVNDDSIPEDEFNGLDDDGDTLVDEAAGHGTHIAGILHLVAPDAQIMPLRVLDSDGRGNVFVIAEAIQYAIQNGAKVINLSLGTDNRSELLKEVIHNAVEDNDVLIVAAAGNLNNTLKQYPAADDHVIGVTAIGPTKAKSSFANYGDWVDVAAPGEDIYSTIPPDGYGWWSGTSMATPFVAGQTALIRSVAAGLTPDVITEYLVKGTAQSLDAWNPPYVGQLGAGLADIGASVGCHWADVWPDTTHDLLTNTCDGSIDIRDIMAQANALDTGNLLFDNNDDGKVDLEDLQRVASRWRMKRESAGP